MSDIAVLVPSYNHSPFIERTLRSIFAQTRQPKQLIVIDDGSKDESPQVIKRVLNECPFDSVFIPRENRGICSTLNEGLSKTSSEYFAYLGSDDIWLPDFLEQQSNLLESRRNAVLAFSHAFVIDENDNIIDRTDNWTAFADGDMLPNLLRGEIFSSPGVLYRRLPLQKYGWNENAVLEDYELYLNLSFEGEFARNEKLLCAWRQHSWNTSDNFPVMLREQIAAQDRNLEKFEMTREELDEIQAKLKFNSVPNLIRSGYKQEAWPLFRENIRAAESIERIAAAAIRLAVPSPILQWNRRRAKRKAIRRYGKLRY